MRNAILIAALLLCSASAQASYNLVDGNGAFTAGGRIYVGTDTNGNSYVMFRSNLSGAGNCVSVESIGDSGGLWDHTWIQGSPYADEVWELYGAETAAPCPGFATLHAFTGGVVLYHTASGADIVYAPASNQNRYIYTENANDKIFSGESYLISGGDGQDWITIETSSGTAQTWVYGDAHGDAICHYGTQPIQRMDGGSGTDWGWFSNVEPLLIISTEGNYGSDNCATIRVAAINPIGN